VKENARHVGGINIFGRAFGNYPQDILLRIRYRMPLQNGGSEK
jgi:predicted transcriptional regulator